MSIWQVLFIMISDSECNMVYISDRMPKVAPQTFGNLTEILDRRNVRWGFVKEAKDIWCRDFMPIQVSRDRFAAFRYYPDYLWEFKKYRNAITDGNSLLEKMGYTTDRTLDGIVLDGGNVVRCGDRVIMTAKVFEENPSYRPLKLLEQLESVFNAKVIVLPWDTYEIFGHSDGICRYVDDDMVLMTNYSQIDRKMAKRFLSCLKPHFKDVVELQYDSPEKYSWAHINWLQTDRVLVVPALGGASDEEALRQISLVMPSYRDRIELCRSDDLIRFKGALNCCTWTMITDSE